MQKWLELKEFLSEKKYYMIGGIIFLLLLGLSIYFCYHQLNVIEEDTIVIEEEKQEEIETEIEDCYVNVDIKGEVKNPGLYQIDCNSRVQNVIEKAGGITVNGDTTLINLGKKVSDEMVIIVYSKKEVANFIDTKEEESKKIDNCINSIQIKNDACIESDNIINQTITNNEVELDTPVKTLVSINKAQKEELMTLSGIGESKANNIINYRNENGNFKSIEELKNVKGIGDSIFEKIKDSITL